MRAPIFAALAAGSFHLGLLGGAPEAAAQEYCVSCSDPDAVYRCIIDGARPASGTPLQMFCVTKMAEMGKHGACSINRVTVLECNGRTVRVAMPAPPAPPPPAIAAPAPPPPPRTTIAPAPPAVPTPAVAPPPAPAPAPPAEAPKSPDTLVGVIKQAGKASKETLQSTGRAIGDGAKKTWNCVTSFFSRC